MNVLIKLCAVVVVVVVVVVVAVAVAVEARTMIQRSCNIQVDTHKLNTHFLMLPFAVLSLPPPPPPLSSIAVDEVQTISEC